MIVIVKKCFQLTISLSKILSIKRPFLLIGCINLRYQLSVLIKTFIFLLNFSISYKKVTNSTLCYVHYCIERQVISRQKPFIVPYILIQWVGMILSKNRIWLLDKYILYDISRIEVETFFKVSTFWSKLDEGSNASWATFKVKVSPFIFFTFLICYYVSIIWSKPIWNSTLNFFYL